MSEFLRYSTRDDNAALIVPSVLRRSSIDASVYAAPDEKHYTLVEITTEKGADVRRVMQVEFNGQYKLLDGDDSIVPEQKQ